jgi:hypothetical protein
MSYSGTVRCSYCYEEGHNRRSCPKLKQEIESNPDGYYARMEKHKKATHKDRECSYCKQTGHNRKTCKSLKIDMQNAATINHYWRCRVKNYMANKGIGIGALVEFDYGYNRPVLCMVTGFDWEDGNFKAKTNSFMGSFVRVRPLTKMDTLRQGDISLRLPTDCEEMPKEESMHGYNGHNRITKVVSPLTFAEVSSQVPAIWLTGQTGIGEMYDRQNYLTSPKLSVIASMYGITLASAE